MIRTVGHFMLTRERTIIRTLRQARKSRLLHALDCDEMQDNPVPSEIFDARGLVSAALA
jgi:hypothetical protein